MFQLTEHQGQTSSLPLRPARSAQALFPWTASISRFVRFCLDGFRVSKHTMLVSMPMFLIIFSIALATRSSELWLMKSARTARQEKGWKVGLGRNRNPAVARDHLSSSFLFSFFLDMYTTTYSQLRVTMPLLSNSQRTSPHARISARVRTSQRNKPDDAKTTRRR